MYSIYLTIKAKDSKLNGQLLSCGFDLLLRHLSSHGKHFDLVDKTYPSVLGTNCIVPMSQVIVKLAKLILNLYKLFKKENFQSYVIFNELLELIKAHE